MPEQQQPDLQINRLYVKDLSLEIPDAPQIFQGEFQPETNIDLNVQHQKMKDDNYEIVLSVTVTSKMKDKTLFLVEVHQAGIFYLKGFTAEQLDHVLEAYCPNILFPYARETVSDLINRGSFPQLNLAPVNFDAFYAQRKQETQKAQNEVKEKDKH